MYFNFVYDPVVRGLDECKFALNLLNVLRITVFRVSFKAIKVE